MMLNIDTSNALDELVARLDQSNTLRQLHADKWRRTYGRIEPGAAASITLVYEKDGALPIRVNVGSQPHEGAQPEAGIGWINSSTCMDDPVLPTLKPAYEAYRCEQIVRYRPGKRCTFRGQSAGHQAFIKVLADDRGDVIAQDSLALQTCRGLLDFDIADCLGWNDDLQALTHRAIPGISVMPAFLRGNAVGMAARIGAALGSLPLSPAAPTATFTARDQIKRTSKYARKFSRAAPSLGPLIDAFVEALTRGHERTPDTPSRTIHGSPHPHQWLDHCGRLALVDFDRLSLGPIEIDVATFVAELDFEKGGLHAEVASFLAAYEKRVGALDHRLMALYRAHKHFAKAFKAALAVERSREARAAAILKTGLTQLEKATA